MATPIDAVVFKRRKIFRTGRVLFTSQKNSAPSQTVATALITARVSPQHLADNVPNFIKIGSLSVEL